MVVGGLVPAEEKLIHLNSIFVMIQDSCMLECSETDTSITSQRERNEIRVKLRSKLRPVKR